ncbi:MAG: class I SAM-dependent methyltransferase, partial [Pseudomonadota bacterium]
DDFKRCAQKEYSLKEQQKFLGDLNFFRAPQSDYLNILQHSEFVDQILGFKILTIEEKLAQKARQHNPKGDVDCWGKAMHQGLQTWVGLGPQHLLTPYTELMEICELLKPRPYSQFVDLGSAYGRMALVLHQLAPLAQYTGIEYVEERVNEANRAFEHFGLSNAQVLQGNLFSEDFNLPDADFYFVYDYGRVDHIRHTLVQIQKKARNHPLKVIARGKGTKTIIEHCHPWLSQVIQPIFHTTFTIYSNFQEN